MRRGHPGIGGWRNENTRYFRPRIGGTPHFRPPRGYGQLEPPRFPPPGVRPPRARSPAPFNSRLPSLISNNASGYHDRMKYRVDNRPKVQRPSERGHHNAPRASYPLYQRMKINEHPNYPNQFQEHRFYEDIETEPCLVNSMGDVDHRQLLTSKDHESYNQSQQHQQMSPWPNTNDKQSYYDNRTHKSKSYQHGIVEINKLPKQDYIGHRPPASDHYGGNPGLAVDSANSFSRSVDDTVDIVRKRLLNRSDSHQHSDDQMVDQPEDQVAGNQESSDCRNIQDLPTKKRTQRQRISNVKTNCDKIKNNIVHQLFKMDKDKIHKLMDNPNSSTKFEYAISSLITESQNSLNRHLRSVAEKSLSTSSDFIHNDNNTIYEDTFMKQMQCILDPQDTVFLEDVKPLVMAELSKALQIDYYDNQFDASENQDNYYYRRGETPSLERDSHTPYHYDDYVNESYFEGNESSHNYENIQHSQIPLKTNEDFKFDPGDYIDRSIFERRKPGVSRDQAKERQISIEKRRLSRMSVDSTSEPRFTTPDECSAQSRKSIDGKPQEEAASTDTSIPLFDTYGELLSDDEDPFAGLDQQYHVAVDPNFIQTYDSSPQPSFNNNEPKSPTIKKEVLTNFQTPEKDSNNIKIEIEDQFKSITKSPLKPKLNEQKLTTTPQIQNQQEICNISVKQPGADNNIVLETSGTKSDQNSQHKEAVKSENLSSAIKSSAPDARKRIQDQRPSHRKEKRKKSEPCQSDSNQQILNKNIIINVNDCAAKELEKCTEAAKSIFNLYFSKDEHVKEPSNVSNKTESTEKSYSDKYVKRKEHPVTSKQKQSDTKKRHRSSSTSHSTLSPKDSVNKSSNSNQNPKTDQTKTKLKDINIFMEQPRKVASVHQAPRNSAVPLKTHDKATCEIETKSHTSLKIVKPIYIKRLLSKETQTKFNENKKNITRFTQTNKKKLSSKFIQTDPVVFAKPGPKATEAFERMKEIDLEIQVLLQEKFQIYSSLESRNPCPNTMQTLGMTVLNVSQFEEDVPETETDSVDMTEDSIVADFTNIPVEELEQIALESVQTLKIEPTEPRKYDNKKLRHQKTSERDSMTSKSPIPKTRKTKTPNISLLEQIITDDRPIEDIISLDDLESSPVAKSHQKQRNKSKPKKKKNTRAKATKSACNKLKQCYVLLNRKEFDDYLRNKVVKSNANDIVVVDNVVEPILIHSEDSIDGISEINVEGNLEVIMETKLEENVQSKPERIVEPEQIVIEETVVNAIHFDMLDVSEDIVIGDVCEVKSSGDKDVMERMDVPVCEEIILDNSQSSVEDGLTAETGLVDNQCKTYDYSTDENLRRDTVTITGNADAVLAIECVENNFLAACLDGNVYYFSGDGQLLTMLRGSNLAVTCLTIVKEKYGTTVYTGSLDSRIRYYDLETGLEKGPECNVLSPIQTMDRAWDTVFVGTRTGFVLQFECKNNMLIPVSTVKFSEQSILALRALKEGPRKVLLVAARSEDVTIKDAQTGLLLRTLFGPKMTVYSLLYEDGKVYCGTSSHQIHVFDYASGSHNGVHEGGKGAVCLRTTGGLLFAGCYDGCVYVYREGEPRPLAQLRGPSVMLLSLAVVGSKIIAGYKDRGLYIWKIPLTILQEMIL